MRIVLDMQGAQASSRTRGIGRYSLAMATAIASNAGGHEVVLALSGLFPETVIPLRRVFDGLIPPDRIRLWEAPGPVREVDEDNGWRRQAAERLREAALFSLKPDVVHVTSLFEGLSDDAVTSIGLLDQSTPTSVTLYDLIPLVHRDTYLANPVLARWYERKLEHMRRGRLWLSISEASRREGIEHLGLPPEWVVNISGAADVNQFNPTTLTEERIAALRHRYGLLKSFAMYTGGIDPRKNIEGLIHAFALLPSAVRNEHQLAIVCAAQRDEKAKLERLASTHGLAPNDVVITGFVPDEDLVALYNVCSAFVFPSWHEGFGLPALEAMACGAAVIGSNTSSLPEVIGRPDALFDPHSPSAIADKLYKVFTNAGFREDLEHHGLRQAKLFSWDRTAQRAIQAFEHLHAGETQSKIHFSTGRARLRMAFVSPMPPERTGIADYSAELLPELARHYDIDVIVANVSDDLANSSHCMRTAEWFASHSRDYDRVIYQMGNSEFHQHMFELMELRPGVVVLHDFFLSGIAAHMELNHRSNIWTKALYAFPGYAAIKERYLPGDLTDIIQRYPCNLDVLQNAIGVIVHSEYSRNLADERYGAQFTANWAVVPLLRKFAAEKNRKEARRELGFGEDDLVVCSFGYLASTKLNHRLLQTWLSSPLSKDGHNYLVFVGQSDGGEYGESLRRMMHNSTARDRVRITGFAPQEGYRRYLEAADVAVQMRTHSRGETSASVYDCMNYGIPTVVNAHGANSEVPDDCVWKVPDQFENEDLKRALETLGNDASLRAAMGERARRFVRDHHAPRLVADLYAQAIEEFYASPGVASSRLIQSVWSLSNAPQDRTPYVFLSHAISKSLPPVEPQRQMLLDTDLCTGQHPALSEQALTEILCRETLAVRAEPVYTDGVRYRYARNLALSKLGCPRDALKDEVLEIRSGDIYLGLLAGVLSVHQTELIGSIRRYGGEAYLLVQLETSGVPHAAKQQGMWGLALAPERPTEIELANQGDLTSMNIISTTDLNAPPQDVAEWLYECLTDSRDTTSISRP